VVDVEAKAKSSLTTEDTENTEEEVVVTAVLCRSGSRNGFRSLLTSHITPPSKFFQNSATPSAPLREIPFSSIRGHLPSFAGLKTQKTLTPRLQDFPVAEAETAFDHCGVAMSHLARVEA
jgi:hypothetical protein